MLPVSVLAVGQRAPEFRLRGPAGQFVALSEYRGQQVVIVIFFPLAFTPICAHQLLELEAARSRLEEVGATVIGISVDSWQANEVFARQIEVRCPLLSDFHRDVSRAYGVLDEERFTSGRALFVVDRAGTIVHAEAAGDPDDPTEAPTLARILGVVEGLKR
ncbi:MAG: redoxin domain-containing protein [Candidatus Eisenbacteria bacterium]